MLIALVSMYLVQWVYMGVVVLAVVVLALLLALGRSQVILVVVLA